MKTSDIKGLLAVAPLLFHPRAAEMVSQDLNAILESREQFSDKDRREMLARSYTDKATEQDVNAARLFRVENDILAHMFGLSFLELQNLGDAEWPIVWNKNIDKYFTVHYIGESGGSKKKQIVERRNHTQFLMATLSTEVYEYPLRNIQIGDIDAMAEVEARLAYEMDLKLNANAVTLLDAAAKTSGLRATMNLHPSIVAANLPDLNFYDFSGVGTNGKIEVEKMKRILDYVERWSSDTSPDQTPLQIKAIYISSTQKRDFWDMVDLVAGYSLASSVVNPKDTIPVQAREGVWMSGKLESMFGYQFPIVTRNTIPAGTSYIAMNKPCGYFWNKPGMAVIENVQDMQLKRRNMGAMWMSKVIQMAVISEWTRNFMKITW